MSQFDSRPPKDNKPRNGGTDPNFNWRGLILFAIAVSLLIGALVFKNSPMGSGTNTITSPQFMGYLQNDQIDKDKGVDLAIEDGKTIATLTGFLKAGKDATPAGQDTKFS